MTINIKYCGGCNPRYDRPDFAKRLMKQYENENFVINSRTQADGVIILCGCSAACVNPQLYPSVYGTLKITSLDGYEKACAFIEELLAQYNKEKR